MKVRRPSDSSGCWLWTGALTHNGYARFRLEDKTRLAHRVAYELFVGPIPEGLTLDHLCRVSACVNPGHLEPVTVRTNILRGEGIAAKNSRKTHCKNGHPLVPINLLAYPARLGHRACRICWNVQARAHEARKRAWNLR